VSDSKRQRCKVTKGKLQPCWPLDEVLQSPGRGTRSQGIEVMPLINMKTFKFPRHIVVAKSGQHGKRGLTFNFCPWCCVKLNAYATKPKAEAV